MSIDEVTRAEGSAAVRDRLLRLQAAVGAGGRYFDPFVAARAQDDLRRAQERMRLGTDLTVVALVGGTGSGKSTLFNAITGLQFADAGEIRPTTERAAACTYRVDADALLDYLEVDPTRRIEHDSILTDGEDPLDGLVLLDLPDHDSVRVGHSVQVERLIPMVDLLVWVLDPQKYADQVLHHNYLRELERRADSMVIVLNQIDTVPEDGREILLADLHRLLEADGLGGIPVMTTSALNGEGIEEVREHLYRVVQGPSATAQTAANELDAIAGRLRYNVGERESDVNGEAYDDVVERFISATGVPAVVESINNAGQSLTTTALVQPEHPGNSMVVGIRDAWLSHVRDGLPAIWQEAATGGIAAPERIRRSVGSAVQDVKLPVINRGGALGLIALGAVVAIVGVVLAVLGIPAALVGRIAVAVGAVACGVACYWIARRNLRAQARRAASDYEDAARKAIGEVVTETMVSGPEIVLDQHRRTREALATFA
ncbi:MAG: ATP-binding cassette domain-containing protein [Actinomycetaceae bacterium]|nr:ATP-binding cassette domain-containing protein [Actinomycetaceae bacterium]